MAPEANANGEEQIEIMGDPEQIQAPDPGPGGVGGVWNVEVFLGGVTQHISVTGVWLDDRDEVDL